MLNMKFHEKRGLTYKGSTYDLLVDDESRVVHSRLSSADHAFSVGLSRAIYEEVRSAYFFSWDDKNSRLFLYIKDLIFEWRNGSLVSLSEEDYPLIYNGYVS